MSFALLVFFVQSLKIINLQEYKFEKPAHELKVTLKLIEVWVAEPKGNNVSDLAKDDFLILDNGRPQEIKYFEKRRIPYKVNTQRNEVVNLKSGRKIVFFFDFAHNTKNGIERAKTASIYFLENIASPSDLISIVSYSLLKGLRVHEHFTREHKRIKEVIQNIGLKDGIGQAEQIEENLWERDEDKKEKKLEIYEKRMKILNFSSFLKKFAKALRYIEGTKHIIIFSAGIPSNLIYGIPSLRDSYQWGDSALRDEYESMAKEFANSNSIIYSINSEGIPDSYSLSLWLADSGEHSLVRLSQLTGGKYYPNTEDLRPAMEDIAKRTSFYYVLGIPVKEEMDGKFHKIEVKVKRKGVKVHAPTGYYNPKPFNEYTDFEKFLHLVDTALSERPLLQEVKEFPLSLTPIDPEKRIYEVSFEISLKELLEGDEGIEVVIIFFDSKREIIKVKREKVEKVAQQRSFSYRRIVEIPSGTEEVRVVIRNLSNGKSMRGVAKVN